MSLYCITGFPATIVDEPVFYLETRYECVD